MKKKMPTFLHQTFPILLSILLLSSINDAKAVYRGYQLHRITLTATDVTLKYVFDNIYKQTGLSIKFLGSKKDLNEERKVTVNFIQTEISKVISFLLSGERNLKFKQESESIIIFKETKKSEESSMLYLSPNAPDSSFSVTGKVTDQSGHPIPGVSVVSKYSNKKSTTNEDGEFILPNIIKGEIVIFKSLGFLSKEVPINKNTILIELLPFINSLDETVVIAYGTTTKRMSTGNVGTLKAADIEKQPVSNPILALQGRVPGIFITQSSGLSGSGVSVRIQGENSIASGNNPLYVIDGIPFTSELLPSIATNNYGIISNGSPMNFINPSDIESIDVLKDADATAIYGSRAANGAVLITTKKGRSGQTKVDVNMQTGWGKITRKLDVLNSPQYLEMRKEAKRNDGIPIGPTDYDINGVWDTTRSTDWQKELLGNTSRYTDLQGSVSGGNANIQYLVGVGYHRETTVFPGNFSDQKMSVNFNLNNTSSNQKFRMQISGRYLVDNNHLPNNDLTQYAINMPPTAPPVYNQDGSLNWAQDSSGNSTFFYNPLAYIYNQYKLKTSNLMGNGLLSYEILPGLNLKSSFGYTSLQSNGIITVSSLSTQPEYRDLYNPRSASYSNSTITTWIAEPQITYTQQFGKSQLDLLLGATLQETNSNQLQLIGGGYLSDAVLEDMLSATQLNVVSTIAKTYKYNAVFARLKYVYDNKYIINLNGRRDGSSRFGDKNQLHNFGSLGVAWIFSSENFIQNNFPFLSFGKVRGSYGITGNDQFEDYKFLDLYSSIPRVAVPYQGSVGLQPKSITNPYLAWEETLKTQFGIDLGLSKDKVLFSLNYNYNRSSNQLLLYILPVFAGFQNIVKNFPATIQNSGWEFSLSTKNISTNHFSWASNANITIPKNKLVDFPNLKASSYASTLEIGKPVMNLRLYHLIGVDPATGQYQFEDEKGNPTFNPNYSNDRIILVKNYPDFYGGFQNSFSYKGFELDIFFQFVKQKATGYRFGTSNPGGLLNNMPNTVMDRWRKPGDIAPVQRFNSDDALFQSWSAATNSDMSWTDASYIRLKNISISWQLPASWKKRAHLNNCKLYVLGQNLLTITKYIGLDPETKGIDVLPPLRVLTIGAQISL